VRAVNDHAMTKLCAVGVPSVALLCAIASCNRDPDACFDECSSFQTQHVCEAAGCGWNDVGFCAPIYRPNDPCFPTVQVDAGDDVDSTVPVDATTGSCNGAVTCTAPLPTCPSGDVPTIANGCWTGICEPIAACDAPPPCADIDDAVDCLARSDCSPTYSGTDCTGSDGSGCVSGGSDCTCTTYVFATCQGR
jgi:hypothetical protein